MLIQVCDLVAVLISSLVNLQIKNPNPLLIKDRIVKVSNLNQGVRCDIASGNQKGFVSWISTPYIQPRRPYTQSNWPKTLATVRDFIRVEFMFEVL
jgi:hypothetical protein